MNDRQAIHTFRHVLQKIVRYGFAVGCTCGVAGTTPNNVTRKQPCRLDARGIVLVKKSCESRCAATMRYIPYLIDDNPSSQS
jgi:hypothetical protein